MDYDFPDGFDPVIRDLIERLLRPAPRARLGACDRLVDRPSNRKLGYTSVRQHEFFRSMQDRWDSLHLEQPPHILPYLPRNSNSEELRSKFDCREELQPGLDDRQMNRLLSLALYEEARAFNRTIEPARRSVLDIPPAELERRLREQREQNEWHQFVENNLILKQGTPRSLPEI